jgi:hypothetical protein
MRHGAVAPQVQVPAGRRWWWWLVVGGWWVWWCRLLVCWRGTATADSRRPSGSRTEHAARQQQLPAPARPPTTSSPRG